MSITRLTAEMIDGLPYSLTEYDEQLKKSIGCTLKALAYDAVGVGPDELDTKEFSVGVVPVTSGKGIIGGFCSSVCAITKHLGMQSHVTDGYDVHGLTQAIESGCDIIFTADDNVFVAINMRKRKFSENAHCTALGYCVALEKAVGELHGAEVLLIGAGRVGSFALDFLTRKGAEVTVVDINRDRAMKARKRFGVKIEENLERAVRDADIIYNASPARIPGEWINPGAIVASPGMPYSFDSEGERKIKILIHDPLQIGVAVMALQSAKFSI
ncbi:3-methylornithyl-N6-L-lysine dehydrogenase PylD [Methermicoccus shengliensis]|uniref:3-methylornithyl-N6-L-lysine dehydrogenase PylD n=1 Tax=Methermicoccus shengliensis TaxID=660064 RepID=UPI00076C8E5A|nr:3-methylornithyl-N6-L-lysine dehydrogenase PylD [Methermicoccus shengliensis]KUK04058.1 MAG: Uncharacterized protein XD46_1225 [Euryarchaeota archaeon 55_53]MDI3488603.1 3-methylornithyl-N6-L-lysine dehydrogenase [Methanosarcinales archaeon]MDN5295617.1 3-methylornithyl-N6-L-lysine dehydrogenase [Methanosarcinales archaeon]